MGLILFNLATIARSVCCVQVTKRSDPAVEYVSRYSKCKFVNHFIQFLFTIFKIIN